MDYQTATGIVLKFANGTEGTHGSIVWEVAEISLIAFAIDPFVRACGIETCLVGLYVYIHFTYDYERKIIRGMREGIKKNRPL